MDKKTLEHLAHLSKIYIDKSQEEKILHDLKGILKHFDELESIDIQQIVPVTGGTFKKNILRQDATQEKLLGNPQKIKEAFREKEGEYLKVPKIL